MLSDYQGKKFANVMQNLKTPIFNQFLNELQEGLVTVRINLNQDIW